MPWPFLKIFNKSLTASVDVIHTLNSRCYQTCYSTFYASPGSVRGTALSSPLTRGRRLLRALLCNAMQCCVALCYALARMPERPGGSRAAAALSDGIGRQSLTCQCVAVQKGMGTTIRF